MLFAVVESLRAIAERPRRAAGRLGLLAVAGSLALSASMFRLWPIMETLYSAPRIMAGTPSNTLDALHEALFEVPQPSNGNLSFQGSFFVGMIALWVALLGLRRLKSLPAALMCAVCVWAATGHSSVYAPFVWLRELPLFETLRYPERFLFFATVYAAELFVLAATRRWTILGLLLVPVFGSCIAGTAAQIDAFHQATAGMWLAPPPAKVDQEFRQARGNRWMVRYFVEQNRGSLSCWEAFPVPQSPELDGALPRGRGQR
jgi:hypothetical protein